MAITEADVRHVAALARVGLPATRVAALVSELNGILGHMAVLQRIDTGTVRDADDGRPPLVARPDVRDPDLLTRPIVDVAPQVRAGFLLVPRLRTHDDADES